MLVFFSISLTWLISYIQIDVSKRCLFSLPLIPESRYSFNVKHLGISMLQHHDYLWLGEQVSNCNLSKMAAFLFYPSLQDLTCWNQTLFLLLLPISAMHVESSLETSTYVCTSVCEGVVSQLRQSWLGCRNLDNDSCEELEWDYNEAMSSPSLPCCHWPDDRKERDQLPSVSWQKQQMLLLCMSVARTARLFLTRN